MKHKKLTLIELMITIMVLGLLVALAIPQFTGVKANADVASFQNDIDTLSKAMDLSYIKNDSLPLGEKVTITEPALLDTIYALGDSASNLYKVVLTKSDKYHSKLKSKIDADSYFIYSMETGKVFYTKPVKDGDGKTLYTMEYIGLTNVKIGSKPLINGMSIPVTEPVKTITGQVPAFATIEVKVNGADLPVTAEDVVFKNETNLFAGIKTKTFSAEMLLSEGMNTITVKVDSQVTNFKINLGESSTSPITIIKPIAVISMTPENDITTVTNIIWGSENSTAVEGRIIANIEWEGRQDIYPFEGMYTVRLRVQDSTGVWSDWVEKDINVIKAKAFTFDSNNYILSPLGSSNINGIFQVSNLSSYIKFGDLVSSGVYYMEVKVKTSNLMLGVVPENHGISYLWGTTGAKTISSNGYLYLGGGTSNSNVGMSFVLNEVIGIKLDMDNKNVTYYVKDKTYTTPLSENAYRFYVTSPGSKVVVQFEINTDPNTFVFDHKINF